MYRHLLLTLHIIGVAAWLGANFVQLVVTPRLSRQPGEVATAWAETAGRLARTYYNVAGTLIGVTGTLLVQHGGWSWTAGFVIVGIAALVVGAALGVAEFLPLARRSAAASRAGDATLLRRLGRRAAMSALVDTSVVVLTVLAMVSKWQA